MVFNKGIKNSVNNSNQEQVDKNNAKHVYY